MATLNMTSSMTVGELKKQFKEAFGSSLKVYKGGRVADDSLALSEIGLKADGTLECRSSLTVAGFIDRMMNDHGLKVKVYTCDEWVACLDGLTLETTGKVKKNAVKADMESMIAYQREDSDDTTPKIATEEIKDNSAEEAAAKAKAEAEKLQAAAEKAAAEKAKAEAEAIAAAKAAAEKTKAELEKQKAEAEAAKAELARIQAETEKAKAAAEAAKAAMEEAKAEGKKATEEKKASAAASNSKGALCGLFSIGENKKVRFSMGNLQFNPKKYEWRFAEHQWDIIGKENEKIAPNYDGWIDLFGYGTSGYMGCEPTETDEGNQYPAQDIANTNYDWGVYNPIVNGGNKEGLWRTLTYKEWIYLYLERANADKLCAKACVNGTKGVILLPDDFYEHRVRISFDSSPKNFFGNTYDLTQWSVMETAGAVFFPLCGCRIGTCFLCDYNKHWTSTCHEIVAYAYSTWGNSYRYYGQGVRLVKDVK